MFTREFGYYLAIYVAIYIGTAYYSVQLFKNAVGENVALYEVRERVLSFYRLFVVATSIFWLLEYLLGVLSEFILSYVWLNLILSLYNINGVLIPIVIILIYFEGLIVH
jgi:hypothetical protein